MYSNNYIIVISYHSRAHDLDLLLIPVAIYVATFVLPLQVDLRNHLYFVMSNPRSLIKHYEAAYGEYAAQNLDVKEQEQVNNAEMSEMYDVNVREPVQAASLSGSNGHSTIVNDIKLNYKPALNASTARNIDNKTGSLTGKIPGGQLQGE